MSRKIGIVVLLGILLVAFLWYRQGQRKAAGPVPPTEPIVVVPEPPAEPEPPPVEPPPTIKKPRTVRKPKPKPKPPKEETIQPPDSMLPPPIELHEELIPENIEIVRFYYSQPIIGPGSRLGFDINGSGYTKVFEKMIQVESGHKEITVAAFKLITLNQIHGTFIVGDDTVTGAIFPQVLIQDKVVFRAPDPFAVIRPGDVLNLVFTEMGESGRSGRFRIYTNLTPEMYEKFTIESSTVGIKITDKSPELPFVINAGINIGWQVKMGNYDLKLKLDGKVVWSREGIIRIVKPNVGQSGLVQKIEPKEKFMRPGEKAEFLIQGSGFQPQDSNLLVAKVEGYDSFISSFSFVAPGRMGLWMKIPKKALVQKYTLSIYQGEEKLLTLADAFEVVPINWTRSISLEPALFPGGKSTLMVKGRDFKKKYIKGFQIEVDEPKITIGKFSYVDKETARADITAGPSVAPGDYWLKMTSRGQTVKPRFGSIIQITQPKR